MKTISGVEDVIIEDVGVGIAVGSDAMDEKPSDQTFSTRKLPLSAADPKTQIVTVSQISRSGNDPESTGDEIDSVNIGGLDIVDRQS